MPPITIRDIKKLSVAERILLAEKIWESIPEHSDANYLSAINSLLVGRKFKSVSSPFSLLPQLGLGMILETPYKSYGDSVVYDLVFFDVSALFKYSFKTCGAGIMIDFQHGFYSSNKYYDKKNRLEISFVFSK
jgi:hypothetical protein